MRAKKNADNAGAASVDFMMFSGYAFMVFMAADERGSREAVNGGRG